MVVAFAWLVLVIAASADGLGPGGLVDPARVSLTWRFVKGFGGANVSEVVFLVDGFVGSDEAMAEFIGFYHSITDWEISIRFQPEYPHLDEEDLDRRDYSLLNEDPVLYVVSEPAVASNLEPMDIARSIFLIHPDSEEGLAVFESVLGDKLRLDSQLFIIDPQGTKVNEWYKISDEGEIVKNTIGRFGSDGGDLVYVAPMSIWNRRYDLRGHTFLAGYIDSPPFVYTVDEEGTIGGLTYDIATLLAEEMNFNMDLIRVDEYGGHLPNGTWSGVVGKLFREEIDLTINDLSITETRSRAVDFALGIFRQTTSLFMQKPRQSLSWTTYVDVFDRHLWLVLLSTIILAFLIFQLVCHLRDERPASNPLKSLSSVLLAVGALSISENPRSISSRMVFLTFCLFGALCLWSYNAVLVSLLAIDTYVLPIQSIEDLLKKDQYQIFMERGTSFEAYFTEATRDSNEVAWRIYEETIKDNPRATVPTTKMAGPIIEEDEDMVFFGEKSQVKLVADGYLCVIQDASKTYHPTDVTFGFQRGSPYVALFSEKILLLKQSGQVQKILDKYLTAKDTVTCDDSQFKAIKFPNIFTAFLLLGTGVAVAWIVGVCERAFPKYKEDHVARKQKERK